MALQKFSELGVVPDVIDEPPAKLATVSNFRRKHVIIYFILQVTYDSGVSVEPGGVLTPTQVWLMMTA